MSGHRHGHRHGHGEGGGHETAGREQPAHGPRPGHDHLGNPEDLAAYLDRLESPERAEWQKPDEVVAALHLAPGAIACDAGAGPGYFALRLARAVGPTGRVHALDAEPRMLAILQERARDAGVTNVHPVLVTGDVPVPPEPCDAILLVNAFHHFPDGVAVLRALAARLRPDGRLVNVDFHAGEVPVGPPPEHKISREDFLATAAGAGLRVVEEHGFLPYQYFVVLARELHPRPGG